MQRRYTRPFARPLKAAWGTWSVRKGSIVRIEDPQSGRAGFGEVAPLPAEARGSADKGHSAEDPAMSFALWSARERLTGDDTAEEARTAALLPLNGNTPEDIARLREAGFRCFKLKLGVVDPGKEWNFLKETATRLRENERLRLDPNRAWDSGDWQFWQPRLNGLSRSIEFIEEPFNPEAVSGNQLRTLADRSPLPFALDESLQARGIENWLQLGWPGYWVVKPSVMGNPENWINALGSHVDRVVLSSVFETGIGLSALVRLASRFPGNDHGLGTQAAFTDDMGTRQEGATLGTLTHAEEEALWNKLS